jgi:hypothetical protein
MTRPMALSDVSEPPALHPASVELTRLRAEILAAQADRDRAQQIYNEHAGAQRLAAAVAEHRAALAGLRCPPMA